MGVFGGASLHLCCGAVSSETVSPSLDGECETGMQEAMPQANEQ